MSNTIELKFPKRRFNAHYGRELVAPDGCYLLPVGSELTAEDMSWTPGEPEWGRCAVAVVSASDKFAWTYARKLPDGQLNDDLPVQGAPGLDIALDTAYTEEQRRRGVAEAQVAALRKEVAEYKSAMDSSSYEREQATIRCRDAEATTARLRDALHAVYENCRQNLNKGIGAGPLARARKALFDTGVIVGSRPLPMESGEASEAEPKRPHDWVARMVPLIERFTPIVIELVQPKSQASYDRIIEVAATMARKTLREAVRFPETSAPPPDPEPHPGAPVLHMTHDGKVTAFGAIEAPPGCYLLPAGEMLQRGDAWLSVDGWCESLHPGHVVGQKVDPELQFRYARKLPANGPVS